MNRYVPTRLDDRCQFNPITAINNLGNWQEDTFDSETIDREFGLLRHRF